MDLRTDRIAQMRTAQWRSAIEQRRDRLPRHPLVGEFIRLGRYAETVVRFQRQAHELARQAILGPTLISLDIPTGKTFAREFIRYDVARGVNRGAGAVDRGRTFRVPAGALFASILHANGAADCAGEDGGIYRCVPRIAASIRTRPARPDGSHLFGRQTQDCCYSIAGKMRLLRAGPQCDLIILDLDHGAGRAHAGMGLERPLVLGLDHARRALEGLVDIAGFLAAELALAHCGAANVVVERRLVGERWRPRCQPRKSPLLRPPKIRT